MKLLLPESLLNHSVAGTVYGPARPALNSMGDERTFAPWPKRRRPPSRLRMS